MYLYSFYLLGYFGFVVVCFVILFLRKCFMWQSLELNSWFSCSCVPGAGIRGMCQHIQLFKSAYYSKGKSSHSKLQYSPLCYMVRQSDSASLKPFSPKVCTQRAANTLIDPLHSTLLMAVSKPSLSLLRFLFWAHEEVEPFPISLSYLPKYSIFLSHSPHDSTASFLFWF